MMIDCSATPSCRPPPPGAGVHKPPPAFSFRIDVHVTEDYLDEHEDYRSGCYKYGECKTDADCTRYVRQPITKLGIWVIEAGPADGNWSSLDSVMILSASANASTYMLGQDVDLTGFALHPVRPTRKETCNDLCFVLSQNPTDAFYAGSLQDWETKVEVPEAVASCARDVAVGVRCRPFGGENDDGQLMWVGGMLVSRTADSMCFVCVDLVAHGPICKDAVSRLADLGAFDKYNSKSCQKARSPCAPPSTGLCAAKLNEFDEIRHLAQRINTGDQYQPRSADGLNQWKRSPWHHFHRTQSTNIQALRERTETITPHNVKFSFNTSAYLDAGSQQENSEFYDLDFANIDSEECSVDDISQDDHSMDEVDNLQRSVQEMDLNQEQVWATLVQGSRVL